MSSIEIAKVGITDLEHLFRKTIQDALREDWKVLRSLEVKPYIATCAQEAEDLAKTKGILVVRGFLSLDGDNGKMLDMNMEMGLTHSEDLEIADSLAGQCKVCVKLMKAQYEAEKPVTLN